MSVTLTTFANGTAFGNLSVPSNQSVGFNDLDAQFSGIPGSTGLLGSNSTTQFAVLAQSRLTITSSPSTLIAGDSFIVEGTLLDDLNQSLTIDGAPSLGIVYLLVDGVPVSSVESDPVTGNYTLSYSTRRYLGWYSPNPGTLPRRTRLG